MNKTMKAALVLLVAAVLLLGASLAFAGATKETGAAEASKKAEIEAGKATQAKQTYKVYDSYLALAKEGKPFPGAPGKGKKLAFANIVASFPFCQSVEKDIIAVAKLAGFADADLIILDNQVDATVGLRNADIILAKKPDGFLEFQIDAKVNAIVGKKFAVAGIPVIAIDVEVPGAPFVGVDNYGASYQTGEWIIEQIEKKWGGIANVDLVLLGATETAGQAVLLRALGTKDALLDKYGKDVEAKIEMQHVGSTAESAQPVFAAMLAKHPGAQKVIISSVNDQTIRGGISAVQAVGSLKRENVIFVAQGCDDSGIEMLRNKEINGDLAYFPEHYGRYCVSAIVAMMQGEPVPAYMFVENVMITPDNVGKWYPKK